jgi:hypothetical protein
VDLTQPVGYRGFAANSISMAQPAGANTGCMIERASYSNVQGVGYTEKRALGDGLDAADVFLSGRRITLNGTLHGETPGALFDLKQELLAAFNPTLAYGEAPYNFGFMPLDWFEPSAREDDFPDGWRHVYANVRPIALPSFDVIRDRLGYPNPGKGLALEWGVMVEAKDPRIYLMLDPATEVFFTMGTDTSGSGSWLNRGDYPAPMYVLLDVGVTTTTTYWHFTGGGATLTLTVPVMPTGGVIRYDGNLKIVTLTQNNIETLRMDLLDLDNEQQHPLIQPGWTDWGWNRDSIVPPATLMAPESDSVIPVSTSMSGPEINPLAVGYSRFWFNEAFS